MQAKYRGRDVVVIRDARMGDPEFNGTEERVLMEADGGKFTGKKSDVVYPKEVKTSEKKAETVSYTEHKNVVKK